MAKSLLIKDTTVSERAQIVREALGADSDCEGIDLLLDTIHFDEQIKGADFILTGEGRSDKQTLMGKVPAGILRRAQKQGIPVHLLSGAIEDLDELTAAGFASVHSINENDPRPLDVLMQRDIAMENMKKNV